MSDYTPEPIHRLNTGDRQAGCICNLPFTDALCPVHGSPSGGTQPFVPGVIWPVPGMPEALPLPMPHVPNGGSVTITTATAEDDGPEEGWLCPRCKRIWAPHVEGCRRCNAEAS